MRIRKRQVPFSLSSLASVTLSDPLLSLSPVVQLQLQDATHPKASDPLGNLTPHRERGAHFDHQPSDQPNQRLDLPIEGGSSGLDCSDNASGTHKEKKKKDFSELLQGEYERGGEVEVEKGNDIRKGRILGAETVNGDVPESRAIYQASGSTWCDGEKSFPPKKRRSSFQRSRSSEDAMMEKDKKMKTKMKTKMISSNRCAQQINKEELGEEKETKARGLENSTGAKKLRARGGALMEGSRCSRVNGRGWRCCQQTLVGYSLCEHHLGKGRLRSMTSVRSRSLAASNTLTALKRDHESEPLSTTSSSLLENELKDSVLDNDCEDEDENKPLVFTKKRMKLGMVKARSIRSLLGQTNNGTVVADNQY
ncbi:uncharacterized protein LOC122278189 [Carya illinoinensis]|uniref:WRC domain-containing protein n=1 Tax=Carya illinoinensis TaxID=32201 RepID=A0A8T1P3B0_CARIL|nr:uncharacterized protein LOC122278189 [Carya illinoinensis]KAG6638299.1 hypothetical protein CIPAW_10G026000 [Carya illinoinensis]KAG6690655.1 hypothetical protein I3842_10G025500 [Carya illinoinensis]